MFSLNFYAHFTFIVLSSFVLSFTNLETGISKRHKEYVLVKCLQSTRRTSFHIVGSSFLHTQQICSDFRYMMDHMAKSLGISPSLFVIHEETMSSSTCRAVRTIAEDCIWDHTNPKYYRHIFQAEQVNNELMLSLHPRMLIGFN